jgi:hypothetical protein
MQFFMLEWWDQVNGKYHQEYYQTFEGLSARFIMLRDDVPGSGPEVTTCHMGD